MRLNQTVEVKRGAQEARSGRKKGRYAPSRENLRRHLVERAGTRFAKADLDHVVAAKHLRFTPFADAQVEVRGWPALATKQEQVDWIRDFSDHGLLFCEVLKA